jgi:hypothetical protein
LRYISRQTLMNVFNAAFILPVFVPYIKLFRFLEICCHLKLSNIKERFGFDCRDFNYTLVYPLTGAFLLLLFILYITQCIGCVRPPRELQYDARENLSQRTNCPQIIEM